ncbi:MAG: sulfite exporter TauE/SafE family protein [Spirochaetota bacterium]
MDIIAIIIGVCTGVLGGLLGIGGAVIMVPALIIFLKFNQHLAQGTALAAMIPPIGLFAAYEYYKNGHVDVKVAILIAAGFLAGAFAGAKLAEHIDATILRKVFGFMLLAISIKIILTK